MTNQPTILDYVTAIGAITTPILVLLLGGLGWIVKNRFDKAIKREEALREDRVEIYNKILEPYIIMFMKPDILAKDPMYKDKSQETAISEILHSVSYRQTAFKLALMGSDEVVRAFNDLMQFFYNQDLKQVIVQDPKKPMAVLGDFLLEIRKSVGNDDTTIQNLEMLEWMITDIRKYKKNGKY